MPNVFKNLKSLFPEFRVCSVNLLIFNNFSLLRRVMYLFQIFSLPKHVSYIFLLVPLMMWLLDFWKASLVDWSSPRKGWNFENANLSSDSTTCWDFCKKILLNLPIVTSLCETWLYKVNGPAKFRENEVVSFDLDYFRW